MTVADASLTSIRDAIESTYGVPPTGTYKERRMVNETLGQDKEAVSSEEIVTDRRNPGNIQVGSSASGEILSELTGGRGATNTWDDYILGALGATGFSTVTAVAKGSLPAGTITPTNDSDPDQIIFTLSAGSWPAFPAGDFIQFTGFTGVRVPFNTIFKVKSGGGTAALTLSSGPRVPTTPGTEDTANVAASTIAAATDASVFRSFTIERKYSLVNEFAYMPGMVLSGFDVELQPKRPMRITWRWIGQEERSATAALGSGLTSAVTSVRSFSPVSDFAGIALDEDGHSFFLTSFRLQFRNGAYLQDEQAGTIGAVGVGLGTFDITGSYEFYYRDGTVHDQFRAFTGKDLSFAVRNVDTNSFVVHLPNINWVSGRRNAAGKDQAVRGRVDFRAAKGSAPYMIRIARL